MRLPRPTPALVVASVALFFALGGSAFAIRDATSTTTAKCAVGTARAIVHVTGDVHQGIANLPGTFSSAKSLFGYRWTCNGGAVQVRKAVESGGGFDISFPGNPGHYPVATAVYPTATAISIAPNSDGSFHITEGGNTPGGSFPERSDASFVIVLF